MTATPPPVLAAAGSVLAAASRGPAADLLLVELSGWLLGAAGEEVPTLTDRRDDLHARLGAVAGRGDGTALSALVDAHADEPEGVRLLASASELYGPNEPDLVLDLAERHPAAWFDGAMLADTSEPARLLGLLPEHEPPDGREVRTVAEVVIAGRESGNASAEAESRWTRIVAQDPRHLGPYRDGVLRVTARESLEQALSLLWDISEWWGRDLVLDGARAVLGRLVLTDPSRAVDVVATSGGARGHALWLGGLVPPGALVPQVAGLVDDLLADDDAVIRLDVARVLAGTSEHPRLDRALRSVPAASADQLARALAPGVFQLRHVGRDDVAEAVRTLAISAISRAPADGAAAHEEATAKFEVLAGAGPTLVPWSRHGGP
jgi:hypothetical protein